MRDDPGAERPGRRVLLVATMRNEGPFILEWVAYHRAIGFTDILICTNGCVDDSPLLVDRLAALGLALHIRNDVPDGQEAQLSGYALAQKHPVLRLADWAMVLDADEFLNVHVGGGTVQDLIGAVPGATAYLVNWRVFGSSGRVAWHPGLVTERFTRAAPLASGVNYPFKTLFTRLDAYHCTLLPHQPRFPLDGRGDGLRYVDGGGHGLANYFFDESRNAFLQSEPGTVSWTLAQVNHYNTRSREDYLVKHRRSDGLNAKWDRDACWPVFDRNEEEDRTILGKLAGAKRLLAAMHADARLHALHERCCALYGAHVTRLRDEDAAGSEGEIVGR